MKLSPPPGCVVAPICRPSLPNEAPWQGITGALFGLEAIATKVRPERHRLDVYSSAVVGAAYYSFAPKPPAFRCLVGNESRVRAQAPEISRDTSMSTSGYPPGWEADYDGDTERWFYTHKPTGVRQYHFPKAGDEVELAAAMSRTKAANELKQRNAAGDSKGLPTDEAAPGLGSRGAGVASIQQVQPSIFSARDDLSQNPAIRRSVSERATPTSPQPIPNLFRQSFQAAQRADATTQQTPFQQSNLTALPPLNTQLHGASRLPYQVASTAHPLRINTNALNQGDNVSPVQTMSAGPWSYSTSKVSGMSSNDRGAPYFSQGSQRIPDSATPVATDPPVVPPKVPESHRAPVAGSKFLDQTHNRSSSVPRKSAGEVIASRLGILYLSDSDKEDVITNLQNLARMYPDVTLSQFVDPQMELPRAKVFDVQRPSQVHSAQDRECSALDTSPAPASAISADASLPIAFIAYSRDPQPTHRTYTSPAAGPNPSHGAPSASSSLDYQRRHQSTSNASITSTPIQTSHDRSHSSSFSSRRQDSIGTQTYSPQTRSELAQTAWGLKPGSATSEGPGMAAGIMARPATVAPVQALESSPDTLGSRPSRQHSVSRKPLSSQSPIMNRPYRSLSWQPRDNSPNTQLPSSLVSEVSEEPSTPPRNTSQERSLAASASANVYSDDALRPTASPELFAASATEAPLQQQPQEKSGIDQKEFDRLNSIIEEQNRQLAQLYQQNVQNTQDLQNQQNASISHQGRQFDNLGHQRYPSVPGPQSTRSSIYTQSSLQNTHYPPSYPSVPVSPISRPESLVYSIRHDQPRPLSLPEPAFDQGPRAGKPEDTERTSENNCLPIDEFELNANPASDDSQNYGTQSNPAPMFQQDVEQKSGVVTHQPEDTTNEIDVGANSVGDRSESRGSNQTDSKRESWFHVQGHSTTQNIPDQSDIQASTNVRDRSESRGSNQTGSNRGSWSHVRTHSATQQIPNQTVYQIAVADVAIPPAASTNVQGADYLVTQEILNITPQIYQQESRQAPNQASQQFSLQESSPPKEVQSTHIAQGPDQQPAQVNAIQQPRYDVSNVAQPKDQHLPSHQRQSSQPRVELQTQQHYMAQSNPASQSQPQSAHSYQTPSNMSQSAAQEISLQTALEAQIQQHFEAAVSPQSAVSPPDPAQSLYGVNSDSAVSDMSTPGLVHKEYFDPVSVRHSQVMATGQRRISKDLSTPASIAEVVEPTQGHARKASLPNHPIAEEPKYYEEKQAFFPDHAPLKIGAVQNTGFQKDVFAEQKFPVQKDATGISTGPSSSGPIINEGSEPPNTSASNQQGQFLIFSRSKNTEAAPTAFVTLESKLLGINPPTDSNTNINPTHAHSPTPSVSSWSEMAKPSYPPPTFTFGISGEKQDDAAAAESLYDGDGYGDYDDYSDGPAPPQSVTPQPHLLQVRRSS
ncbi:hypothetical protein V493_01079 [Pseudogymnoascus sp. VKM F-4281 (FW-2241)]|nr:hypothetical protein V493_01079 [Pseudogymnoascus sp. VKM F-4281 (FW-2241)]